MTLRRAPRFSVSVQWEVEGVRPPDRRWLVSKVQRLAALADVCRGGLAIRVVGDREMSRLHSRYKRVRGTTDVLTFDLREKPTDPLEGDLVVCLDEAARQARRRKHPIRVELLLYILHGLLHLQGFDDHKSLQFQRMHRKEDELLRQIGLPPAFFSSPRTNRSRPK